MERSRQETAEKIADELFDLAVEEGRKIALATGHESNDHTKTPDIRPLLRADLVALLLADDEADG